ncbi:hypothetical protein AD940_03195 [Gluconobacter thailandicus]|nr:hypothetical protein AD940_03195 [Gluconobacter thailandicus]
MDPVVSEKFSWLSQGRRGLSFDEMEQEIKLLLSRRRFRYPNPIRMTAGLANNTTDYGAIPLFALNGSNAKKLLNFRKDIEKTVRIFSQSINVYRFHITFGYFFRSMPLAAFEDYKRDYALWCSRMNKIGNIATLAPPVFCHFDNMLSYYPITPLKQR